MGSWHTQSEDDKGKVLVRVGFDRDLGRVNTEFLVIDKMAKQSQHSAYDAETGDLQFKNPPKR